jgi:hypothetical protein
MQRLTVGDAAQPRELPAVELPALSSSGAMPRLRENVPTAEPLLRRHE